MARLKNKIAVITGGGSGIGLETAKLFASEGAKLMLSGRNEKALQEAVTLIGAERAAHIVADVSGPEDNQRLVKSAEDRFGGIDIFLANAGVEGVTASIVDYPAEAFDQVMAVNVRGVFLGLKYAIPAIRKRGGGSIVITSSIGGIKARGMRNSAYITSKHAEIGLMRTAAIECAPYGIRVNCVLPGPTETRMIRKIEEGRSPGAPEKAREMIVSGLPFKRYGTPAEIANLVLFLSSEEASICTGGVYCADGGLSAI
ncbi:MAG TPA: SDR family oxidoreductase [Sphingomonadales bacterium]|nr:SDR family oxidoreductase [Sphingomonadales bacterium]